MRALFYLLGLVHDQLEGTLVGLVRCVVAVGSGSSVGLGDRDLQLRVKHCRRLVLRILLLSKDQ
jgi:hypothetical protein